MNYVEMRPELQKYDPGITLVVTPSIKLKIIQITLELLKNYFEKIKFHRKFSQFSTAF